MYTLGSLVQFIREMRESSPTLELIGLSQIILFLRLAVHLRNEILLVQPSDHPVDVAPRHLSPSLIEFLGGTCSLAQKEVLALWFELKDTVWSSADDPLLQCLSNDTSFEALFDKYGQVLGFHSSRTIWPETKVCTNSTCKHNARLKLHTVNQRHAILLTQGHGPIPVWAVYFTCNGCRTQYHPDYRVSSNGVRIYNPSISDHIQIEDHVFVERGLIEQWRLDMNLAWHVVPLSMNCIEGLMTFDRMSATNCMSVYLRKHRNVKLPESWNIGLNLSHRTVGEAFMLYSLWADCSRRSLILELPHGGNQRDRFKDAVRERNYHIKVYGQSEKHHFCDQCVRHWRPQKPGDPHRTTHVVVCDGKAMGSPCCRVENCQIPLARNKDRFCPDHADLANVCAVVSCDAPIRAGFQTCSLRDHAELERRYKEKGQAAFQLTERLQRAGMSHLDSSEPIPQPEHMDDDSGDSLPSLLPVDDDDDDEIDEDDEGDPIDPTSLKPAQLKALFGRRRSHNEQLLIGPCGMIIARETFFFSESLPSVVHFFRQTYCDGFVPDHLIFDNNCGLAKHVRPRWNDPLYAIFQYVGLAVDVFHFKSKHKLTDTYCQKNCNPASFPELMSDDGKSWWFNTSVAEQTNAWLGGYLSMCREMTRDVFTFFLDEMIMMRNEERKRKLELEGAHPSYWVRGDK